jgi:hypothetical protein
MIEITIQEIRSFSKKEYLQLSSGKQAKIGPLLTTTRIPTTKKTKRDESPIPPSDREIDPIVNLYDTEGYSRLYLTTTFPLSFKENECVEEVKHLIRKHLKKERRHFNDTVNKMTLKHNSNTMCNFKNLNDYRVSKGDILLLTYSSFVF